MDKETSRKRTRKRQRYFSTHPSNGFYDGLTPEEIAFINQPVYYYGEEESERLQDLDESYKHRFSARV